MTRFRRWSVPPSIIARSQTQKSVTAGKIRFEINAKKRNFKAYANAYTKHPGSNYRINDLILQEALFN